MPTFVQSRDGKTTGQLTGAAHRCRLEGCRGERLTVRWPGGRFTHPCSKGLTELAPGLLRIV